MITLLMVLTILTQNAYCSATEATVVALEADEELAKVSEIKPDLEQAETKDGQTEILKQIRRLNDDGSYTVGYEAEDGTFKFESRDVLGNIKGTYGYIDENGEIKRVTYTGKNETGLRNSAEDSTAVPTKDSPTNRTFHASTTRRPTSLAYLTSTPPSVTRTSVIQPIPRKRVIVPYPDRSHPNNFYPNSKQSEQSDNGDKVTSPTVIYATSVPSSKPIVLIRPTALPQSATRSQDQVPRPEKLEGDPPPNPNIRLSTSRETSTSKPVTEILNDKDLDRKSSRGNHLRRQLGQQERNPTERERDERFSTQQQIIYSQSVGDEGGQIYGGSVTTRPIFSTTHSPRTPGIVLAARHRAAQIQNSINSQTTTTTEKVYVKPPRRPDTTESSNFEQTTQPSSENTYHTQTAGPIVQIPPNREIQAAADDDPVVYRRRPIPPPNFEQQFRQREYPRQYDPATTQRGLYRIPQQTQRPDRQQFLRETTQNPNELGQSQYNDDNLVIPPNLPPFRGQAQRPRANYARQYSDQQQQVQGHGQDGGYEQQSYQLPFAQNPYRETLTSQFLGGGGGYPNRPLTTNDFERLLQLLILKHQQLQQARLGYFGPTNPYIGGGGLGGTGYTQSPFGGYQQIPRPPIYDPAYYDPRNPYYRAPSLLGRYSEQENVYQAQNQIQDQTLPYDGQRLIPRKKQYNPRYFGASASPAGYPDQEFGQQQVIDQHQGGERDYLPPNVREDLLYRMLMLAIQSEQNGGGYGPSPLAAPSNLEPATTLLTTTTRSTPYNRKPVRSVEILGEDN